MTTETRGTAAAAADNPDGTALAPEIPGSPAADASGVPGAGGRR